MVKLQIGNEVWRIRFMHHPNTNPKKRYTDCWITKGAVGQPSDQEVVAEGRAKCHAGDVWDKALGRKIALAKALQSRAPAPTDPQDVAQCVQADYNQHILTERLESAGLTRAVRTALWTAYWAACKPKITITVPEPV